MCLVKNGVVEASILRRTAQSAAAEDGRGRHQLRGDIGMSKSGNCLETCTQSVLSCYSVFILIYLRMMLVICLAQRREAERLVPSCYRRDAVHDVARKWGTRYL